MFDAVEISAVVESSNSKIERRIKLSINDGPHSREDLEVFLLMVERVAHHLSMPAQGDIDG